MAQLHYRHGTMGSSKTALALMLAYNYQEKGQKPLLAKPEADTRTTKMWSRVGLSSDCISLEALCAMSFAEISAYDCVIIDEAQFATAEQIDYLGQITDYLDLPVFAYGLRTDYTGHLFEGSKRLMEIADTIEENQTICWCGRPAKFSARVDSDGNIIREGTQLQVGDSEYIAVCRKHYMCGRIKR